MRDGERRTDFQVRVLIETRMNELESSFYGAPDGLLRSRVATPNYKAAVDCSARRRLREQAPYLATFT